MRYCRVCCDEVEFYRRLGYHECKHCGHRVRFQDCDYSPWPELKSMEKLNKEKKMKIPHKVILANGLTTVFQDTDESIKWLRGLSNTQPHDMVEVNGVWYLKGTEPDTLEPNLENLA